MRTHAETVLQEALTLAERERAEIAGALLESLEPEPEANVEAALDAGGIETTPWEEIRVGFLARLSERRPG